MRNEVPESTTELAQVDVLIIGLKTSDLAIVDETLRKCQVRYAEPEVRALVQMQQDIPSIVFYGHRPRNVSSVEMAQLLRQKFQDAEIYLLSETRDAFDREILIHNGFSETFLMPFEKEIFEKKFRETISKLTLGSVPSFQPVKVLDFKAGTVLDFNTYQLLPLNNRIIKFTASGEQLTQAQVDKLLKHQIGTLHVETLELPKFFVYSKSIYQSRQSQEDPQYNAVTQRKAELRKKAREFMHRLMNSSADTTPELSQSLKEECLGIVKEYVLEASDHEWYLPLLNWQGDQYDAFEHAANVCLYSVLFASRLNLGDVEEVALAALLHDIGLGNVSKMDRAGAAYERHTVHSSNFLKNRQLEFGSRVARLVLTHHERFDGSGYPHKSAGMAIPIEAQLIGIIDEVDYRISVQEGKASLTPLAALKNMQKEPAFNPKLIQQMLNLFPLV